MSNTITVNIDNLTPEERETLLKLVEKGNTDKKWWQGTKFDVKAGEKYFHVGNSGVVLLSSRENEPITGKARWAYGNACKDEAYVERRVKEIKLYNILSNFAEIANEGWTPNWEKGNEYKWYVMYSHIVKEYAVTCTTAFNFPNTTFFKTKELAQRAINEIILPFERGEL